MILVNLTAENFGPFNVIDYDFCERPVLIQGENLTDDSQESNGSGKSFIQAAIEYCLFKTTSFPGTDSELIRIGEEQATVGLEIYCPIRKELLTIRRTISLKDSSKLSIRSSLKTEDESFSTVNDGNKLILNWIGISVEDLQNYYIINKERYTSIFKSSNKEKIEMINRFSNAKLIDGVDKKVEEDVKKLNDELKGYGDLKTSSESKIDTLKEQIQFELDRDFEAELKEFIQGIKDTIEFHEEKIEDKKLLIQAVKDSEPVNRKQIEDSRESIKEKVKLLADFDTKLAELSVEKDGDLYIHLDTQLCQIKEKQEKVQTDKKQARSNIAEITDILDEIEKNIKGSVTCPKCAYQFLIGNSEVDIEAEKLVKIETEDLLKRSKESFDSITKKLDDLEVENSKVYHQKEDLKKEEEKLYQEKKNLRLKISGINTDVQNLNDAIDHIEKSLKKNKEKIEDYEREIELINKDIQVLRDDITNAIAKTVDQKRIDEINIQIRAEEDKLKDIEYSFKRKETEIFETTQWILNFSKFNMYLANQSLKIIQGYCNKFLQDIKSDIQIKWEGIKILADGKKKEEITPYVIRDGVTRKFGNFSGGERGRIDYSMIMTLQTMINKTHKYGGLDFLSTDEIAEGIDPRGLSDLMKSLENFNKTILITTHVVNRNISENTLLVRKEKGISTIVTI